MYIDPSLEIYLLPWLLLEKIDRALERWSEEQRIGGSVRTSIMGRLMGWSLTSNWDEFLMQGSKH